MAADHCGPSRFSRKRTLDISTSSTRRRRQHHLRHDTHEATSEDLYVAPDRTTALHQPTHFEFSNCLSANTFSQTPSPTAIMGYSHNENTLHHLRTHADTLPVSHVTPVTSAAPPVLSAHTTARRGMHNPIVSLYHRLLTHRAEPSRRAASPPTPASAPSASISSAPAAATASSVACVSRPATSRGEVRASRAKCVSSSSPSTRPTTSSCAPTP